MTSNGQEWPQPLQIDQIVPKCPNNRQMTGLLLSDIFSQAEINVLRGSYESVAEWIRILTMEPYESLT